MRFMRITLAHNGRTWEGARVAQRHRLRFIARRTRRPTASIGR